MARRSGSRAVIKSSSRSELDGNPGSGPPDSRPGRMFMHRVLKLDIRFCREWEVAEAGFDAWLRV